MGTSLLCFFLTQLLYYTKALDATGSDNMQSNYYSCGHDGTPANVKHSISRSLKSLPHHSSHSTWLCGKLKWLSFLSSRPPPYTYTHAFSVENMQKLKEVFLGPGKWTKKWLLIRIFLCVFVSLSLVPFRKLLHVRNLKSQLTYARFRKKSCNLACSLKRCRGNTQILFKRRVGLQWPPPNVRTTQLLNKKDQTKPQRLWGRNLA